MDLVSRKSLSHVWLFVTLWTSACQASLSFIISWSLLKLMSIESVMPCNHLILYRPLLLLPSIFPNMRVFSNESALHISWPKMAASASASVLLMSIEDLFPLGLTGLISLKSKGLSRVFCSIPWNHRSFYVHSWSLSTRTQALFARPWKNIWIFPPRFPTLHQFLMVHRNDKSRIAKVFFF